MANKINYNFRTGEVYASSDGMIGKPLEIYINLQNPETMKRLEDRLRDVLQDKLKEHEEFDEHTRLFADKETTVVKSYIIPEEKKPIEGDYPTMFVYRLVCNYNLTFQNMAIINSGGQLQSDPEEDLQKKMDLVSPSDESKSK